MSNLNTTTLNNTAIVNNINKESKFSKTKSKLMFYLQSSSKGVLVGITAFFICHPLEVIKTRKQASFSNSNFEVIKETYTKGGFRSFYSGCVPNLIRYSIRNAYRWPLMLYLPAYFSKYFDHMKAKLISAVSLANIECFIITPLERLKVYIMVNSYNNSPSNNNTDTNNKYDSKHPIKKVLYNKDYWKMNEIYKGIAPLILRQNISWLSFLGSDHYLKMLFTKRKLAKNSENNKLNFKELNMVSFLVAIINTFFGKIIIDNII